MEVPIPNFYFMAVQFIHLLALSVWVGGIVSIGMIVAPTLFQKGRSRQTGGELMGEILRKFDIVSLACIAALAITGVIKYWTWENLTPWNLSRYLSILVMSGAGLYSAFAVSPKLRSWTGSPASANAISISDFNRLHHLSIRLMTLNLICGVVALLMA
ncbi:MAG: DUF4149 domain-containing protein [Candidatus Manganitrophaceae bacterium]